VNATLGIVVIGRNEGARLERCLASVVAPGRSVVYVDSGSTDGSPERARALGADVVALDLRIPFTAARARNAGVERLVARAPQVGLVQFVDGDCEVIDGWIDAASAFLQARPDVVAVCGRLAERHPDRSLYNRLCDLEWDRPPGATHACGGIVMMRRDAFAAVGGFDAQLVAGEEPELCARLRAAGGVVWRLPDRMAWHDADMHRFGQWWQRAARGGFAMAQTAWLRRGSAEQPYRQARTAGLVWALGVPLAIAAAVAVFGPPALWLALVYPLQVARLALAASGSWRVRLARGVFLVLARFAELWGRLRFAWTQQRGRASATRFDYKTPTETPR
jgi:GT2 family glycosyltransferase